MPRPRRRRLLLAALVTLTRADRLQDEGVELRIAAKQTRCIYEELPEGVGGTLEVFVLAGGGEMDIDVAVDGPMTVDDTTGLPSKARKPAARVTVKSGGVNEDRFASPTHVALAAPRDGPGAYSICLDNSGSRYTEKVVSLAVRTSEDKGNAAPKHKKDKKKGGRNSENVEKVEARVVALRGQLATLKDKQARERRRLAKHRALYDARHDGMVQASLMETCVYVLCSVFQLVFVRRWFAGKGGMLPVYKGNMD